MKNLITTTITIILMASGISAQNKKFPVSIDARDNDISIEWSTASETNSSYFLVEGSSDGLSFTTISRVKAAGYSVTPKNYEFELRNNNPPLYCRITEVAMDGGRSSSPVVNTSSFNGSLARK
jgi:hypothetical protein